MKRQKRVHNAFKNLSDNIFRSALPYLEGSQLIELCLTSKRMYNLVDSIKRTIWNNIFKNTDERFLNFLLTALWTNKCNFCELKDGPLDQCSVFGDNCHDRGNKEFDCICKYVICCNCKQVICCDYCELPGIECPIKGCDKWSCKKCCIDGTKCPDHSI